MLKKALIIVYLFTIGLYAGNAGLTIVNKLNFEVEVDMSTDGVRYMYDRRDNTRLFPGESLSLNINCKKKYTFRAYSVSGNTKWYEVKFVPECGMSHTWKIEERDKIR